jgi:hypothetical protein
VKKGEGKRQVSNRSTKSRRIIICNLLKYLKYLKCYNNVVNKTRLPELDAEAMNVSVIGVHCIMHDNYYDYFSGSCIFICQNGLRGVCQIRVATGL